MLFIRIRHFFQTEVIKPTGLSSFLKNKKQNEFSLVKIVKILNFEIKNFCSFSN